MGIWLKLKPYRVGVDIPGQYKKTFYVFTYHSFSTTAKYSYIIRNHSWENRLSIAEIINGNIDDDEVGVGYEKELNYLFLYRQALEHFNKYMALL